MQIVAQPHPPFGGLSLGDDSEILSDRAPIFQGGYAPPIQLYGSTEVRPGSGDAHVSDRAFTNLSGFDIEILKIAFVVKPTNTVPTTYTALQDLGATVQVALSLGASPLTTSYVPLWALARSEDRTWERLTSSYVWTLTHPLRLHPGECLSITLKHGTLIQDVLTVDVTAQGRIAAIRHQETRKLPFVSSFIPSQFVYGVAGSDTSAETELWNNTKRIVHLDRFIGRTIASATAGSNIDFEEDTGVGSTQLTLAMNSSSGKVIVGQTTNFDLVFPPSTRSLELTDCVLQPNEHVTVTINQAVPTVSQYSPYAAVQLQPHISMVGWREE